MIANGAGLAMSTAESPTRPTNFLDIGGGANADVMAGREVINNDPNVKSIFINIFGGITRGEEVANGILEAMQRVEIDSPIVIRLDGTNAEEGRHPGPEPQRQADDGDHARRRPQSRRAVQLIVNEAGERTEP